MIIIRWQRYGLFVKQPRKWKYLFSVTTVLVSRWWQAAEPEHFKGTAGFGDFQIFGPDLLRVVATGWERCDKGRPKAKILSFFFGFSLTYSYL